MERSRAQQNGEGGKDQKAFSRRGRVLSSKEMGEKSYAPQENSRAT